MYTKQQLESQTESELWAVLEECSLDVYEFESTSEAIAAILEEQARELAILEKLGVIAKARAEAITKHQSIVIVKNRQGYWALPCLEWLISKPEDVPDWYTYVTTVNPA